MRRALLTERRQLTQQQVRALCLARPALAADHNALVLLGTQHQVVRAVGDGEDVWRVVA